MSQMWGNFVGINFCMFSRVQPPVDFACPVLVSLSVSLFWPFHDFQNDFTALAFPVFVIMERLVQFSVFSRYYN